jgi:hypothetical protein
MLNGKLLCVLLLVSLVASLCFSLQVSATGSGSSLGVAALAQPIETPTPTSSGVHSYNYSLTILGHPYTINAETNSELSNFAMTNDGMGIQFHAVAPSGADGFCDFRISTTLLGSQLAVLVDGSPLVKDVNYTQTIEGTNNLFHITFGTGSRDIMVTSAVVETPIPTTTATAPQTTPPQTAGPTPSPEQSPKAPSNETAWVPKTQDAVVATVAATVAVGAMAGVFSAANSAVDQILSSCGKVKDVATSGFKKWLERYVMSKRKMSAGANPSKIWRMAKPEIVSYAVSIPVMAFAFLYVQKSTLAEFLLFLPTILLVSVMVYFVRVFSFIVASRQEGAWLENRLWYLGLGSLIVTTLIVKMPLLTTSQNVICGDCTKSLKGKVATAELLVTLAFGGIFYFILRTYSTIIGGTGFTMCVTATFFNAYPVSPMKGKDIFGWSKALWVGIFALALAAYIYWLLLL